MSSTIDPSSTSTISSTASATSSAAKGLIDQNANKSFKIVGICLAVGSGLFIGTSFVIKKKGLLRATSKYGNSTGEGHAYLKSPIWWTGMIMMVIGEILNFVAYAFTEAILVTPMGALSVVVSAILSHFFLKESLTFFGWIGCTLCIIGATILALNAPEQQSVTTINAFKHLFVSPGFLVWASLCVVASGVVAFLVAPRWGKTNMMPYISICSLIGGISVSCTQGLGSSIVTSIQGDNQVKNWFFWFLFIFVVVTLLTEINYLNKALELFNTASVVPVYFCFFTTATLITSFILYDGLKASAVSLITMVMGFLVICLGITLLQLSKIDPTRLTKLDRKSTMLFEAARHETEQTEKGDVSALEDPGMDALRGGFGAIGSIIRARSVSRRMSSASQMSAAGKRWPYENNNLSTQGLGHLQRFQLSDNPMPSDALDQISLHGKSPISLHPSSSINLSSSHYDPPRSPSHLKFEEADVVHQYDYGSDEAQHYSRKPHLPPLQIHSSPSGPGTSKRQTSNPLYPPVLEEPEEEENDTPTTAHGTYEVSPVEKSRAEYYPDPYRKPAQMTLSPSAAGGSKLASLFHFSHSQDPSMVRGGSHRGVRDYPHLPKGERGAEREERAALVIDDADEKDEEVEKVDEDDEGSEGGRYGALPTLASEERVAQTQTSGSGGGRLSSVGGPRGPRGPAR